VWVVVTVGGAVQLLKFGPAGGFKPHAASVVRRPRSCAARTNRRRQHKHTTFTFLGYNLPDPDGAEQARAGVCLILARGQPGALWWRWVDRSKGVHLRVGASLAGLARHFLSVDGRTLGAM